MAKGVNPASIDPASRKGRLLQAEMASIKEVMDENQALINEKGSGFKGFIPPTFARLVTERLQEKIGDVAEIKVTAPPNLVRNRKSRARRVGKERYRKQVPGARAGLAANSSGSSRPARGVRPFASMVPEIIRPPACPAMGPKKGEMDITGYPKEGASEGDLGGVISITLFRTSG